MLKGRHMMGTDFLLLAVPLASAAVLTVGALTGLYVVGKTAKIVKKIV